MKLLVAYMVEDCGKDGKVMKEFSLEGAKNSEAFHFMQNTFWLKGKKRAWEQMSGCDYTLEEIEAINKLLNSFLAEFK